MDRLSGGRLVLGVGGGDNEAEAAQLGMPLPPVPARRRAVEETVRIVGGLWTGGPFTFAGEQFAVREATFRPVPVQSPHVPLLPATGRLAGAQTGARRLGDRVRQRQALFYTGAYYALASPCATSRGSVDAHPPLWGCEHWKQG
ncbi:MAG: hypothetical protein AVDCRST_MAG77-1160 [uncultured Chloroflexi bacterium]|uniref:Luciferase-like domain-containing protein n=1 Tax=uncultured Chloroflexota bacterium TaxID=166587 RepID=A0A6J4HQ68_9CHLR|nr:MAG: hypothetical protein AVDCRST_MAG77-1160 [uncultured Chloroflexota bacterium]